MFNAAGHADAIKEHAEYGFHAKLFFFFFFLPLFSIQPDFLLKNSKALFVTCFIMFPLLST
jgi:hypothetical protein